MPRRSQRRCQFAQQRQLRGSFHALGYDVELQVAAHLDHGANERRIVRRSHRVGDEALVDFQSTYR